MCWIIWISCCYSQNTDNIFFIPQTRKLSCDGRIICCFNFRRAREAEKAQNGSPSCGHGRLPQPAQGLICMASHNRYWFCSGACDTAQYQNAWRTLYLSSLITFQLGPLPLAASDATGISYQSCRPATRCGSGPYCCSTWKGFFSNCH
jgi:hypothetical protein